MVLAYRTEWNPLPACGVVGLVLLVWHLPYRAIAEGVFVERITDPIAYVQNRRQTTGDVLVEANRAHRRDLHIAPASFPSEVFNSISEKIRPYYVDVDGSSRHSDFQQGYNPVTLPFWLRLMLLPDFVGLNTGARRWTYSADAFTLCDWYYKPELKLDPYQGNSIRYEPMMTAPELVRWIKAYPQISALLGRNCYFTYSHGTGAVGLVFGDDHPPGRFPDWLPDSVLGRVEDAADLPADALPYAPMPFVPEEHPNGHLAKGFLYLGEQFLDRAAGGHWLKIDDLNNTLVMGTAGFGKSVFLNQVLQGVRHNPERFDQVLLVDLKGGVELWPYQALGAQFRVVYRLDDLPQLVAQLVTTVETRLEEMRGLGVRMWPGAKTLLVVDEYAQIQLAPESNKEEKQRKYSMLADLNKLSMLGRAAGVVIWAQLQKGTTDVMDSSFRANLANQVCFKVPNKLTAAGMFGSTDELMVDPVKLPKGRFVLFDASNGETHYLQARVV